MHTRVRGLVPRQQTVHNTEETGHDQLSHVRQHGGGQGHHGASGQDLQEERNTGGVLRDGGEC